MRRLIAVIAVAVAVPSFAASPAVCDKFIKAFEKAGKASGKALDAEGAAFWRSACLKDKEKDETITKQTKCLEAVKAGPEIMACLK